MRDIGIPKLLRWRWAPCAALVLGTLSFVAFTLLAIPDRIGGAAAAGSSMRLGSHLSRAQGDLAPSSDWSSGSTDGESEPPASSQVSHLASRGTHTFPKRGFTPPLDRPAGSR